MDSITVYWSRLSSNNFATSPSPVRYDVFQKNIESSYFYTCPAFKDSMHNVYSVKSQKNIDINLKKHNLYNIYINKLNSDRYDEEILLEDNLYISRDSQLKDHVNLRYNESFIFFSTEPLVAKFTAPYLPPTSPTPNSLLAQGQFDIGNWYRRYNLEYFIPTSADKFLYKNNDDLFFLELKTDKKIIFKEYDHQKSNFLLDLESQLVGTLNTMPIGSGMAPRYSLFKKNQYRKKILEEISKVTKW